MRNFWDACGHEIRYLRDLEKKRLNESKIAERMSISNFLTEHLPVGATQTHSAFLSPGVVFVHPEDAAF